METGALEDKVHTSGAANEKSAAEVSGTNNQIAAVDEADIVKADEKHLYVAKGNQLRIFQSWPPDAAKELSPIPIEGQAKRLLKVDNKLLVISFVANNPSKTGYDAYYPYSDNEFLDPYPPYFSKTLLTLFDVSNPASPQELRKLTLHARFETARSIGNNAVLVLSEPSPFGTLENWYPDVCVDRGNSWRLVSERKLRADYVRALNKAYENLLNLPMETFGLHIEDSIANAEPISSRSCSNTFINPKPDGVKQTSVVRIDLSKNAPVESATILSSAGEIFVSENSVYLAVPHWRAPNSPWFENWDNQTQVSVVHKFVLPQNRPPTYVASGIVKGTVLNSFSMDEDKAFLRIATTTSPSWWDSLVPQENILSVLQQEGPTLKLHGQLNGLALNEQIRSARFTGNRAYIVTFRQTDPLFAIDLSDPQKPRLLGELEIPGFSTYIHPLDDNHLLTVGYDANPMGIPQGIQVQLFDISKPEKIQVKKHALGPYSSSEAAQTHLGFSYQPSLKLLALPVSEWDSYNYGYINNFEGVRLFCIHTQSTTDAGAIQPCGLIPYPEPPKPYAPSSVLRNVFMLGKPGEGNYLYSLSNNVLFSSQLPLALPTPPPEPTLPLLQKFPLN